MKIFYILYSFHLFPSSIFYLLSFFTYRKDLKSLLYKPLLILFAFQFLNPGHLIEDYFKKAFISFHKITWLQISKGHVFTKNKSSTPLFITAQIEHLKQWLALLTKFGNKHSSHGPQQFYPRCLLTASTTDWSSNQESSLPELSVKQLANKMLLSRQWISKAATAALEWTNV